MTAFVVLTLAIVYIGGVLLWRAMDYLFKLALDIVMSVGTRMFRVFRTKFASTTRGIAAERVVP